MEKKSIVRQALDVLLFVGVFFLYQVVAGVVAGFYSGYSQAADGGDVSQEAMVSAMSTPLSIIVVSCVSSVLTIATFWLLHWCPFERMRCGNGRAVLLWTALLALGFLVPSACAEEWLGLEMSDEWNRLFEGIMGEPWGYLAIGILAPVAEEMVFRGAILRTLLSMTGRGRAWLAIVLSALIFGGVHMNLPQFVHAAFIGLVLGWLYWRSGSILPGIVLHWVNNTVAFLLTFLYPELSDAKTIDLFGGNMVLMWVAFVVSVAVFVACLWRLWKLFSDAE